MLHKGLDIGESIKLDGFLFEVSKNTIFLVEIAQIRGSHYGDTVERFGETVRRVLTTISDHDPGCDHMMDNELISRRGWR